MQRRGGGTEVRPEFDQFVARAADGLLRAAYLITWDLAEAEDLVQECLFRVARRWPRVRKMEYPVAYARKVLVHLALDDGSRRSRRRGELAPATGVFVEHEDIAAVQVIGRVEDGADLMRALEILSPRQRAALVLRYFEDLSEAETATLMGCSVGTVKSTTSRALDRLRESIERPGVSINGADRATPNPSSAPSAPNAPNTAATPRMPTTSTLAGARTTAPITQASITESKRSVT